MARVCPQLKTLILAAAAIHLASVTLAFTQERDSVQDFERCKAIASDSARLDCLKKLRPNAWSDAPTEGAGAVWPLHQNAAS